MDVEQVERFAVREGAVRSETAGIKELPVKLAWSDSAHGIWLYHADCLVLMDRIAEKYPDGIFDMIFADPPYFLSNGGITWIKPNPPPNQPYLHSGRAKQA